MTVLADSSALFAMLDVAERHHVRAADAFAELVVEDRLVSHSFVVGELIALAQGRLGLDAVRTLVEDVLQVVEIVWVDESLYRRAVSALLAAGRRGLSLADWTSFELMRERGIRRAFALDDDFARQGFELVP